MQITIKQGEKPNTEDVLNALVNNAFHEDGTPWQPTPEQVSSLIEIFGAVSDDVHESNVVPIHQARERLS